MTPVRAGRPPNYEAIAKVFPRASRADTIFSYGTVIYCLDGGPLSTELQAHEEVHCARQMTMGLDLWWDRYLADKQFRFDEELLAHRAEWEAHKADATLTRNQRRSVLRQIARRLAGPLYGNMVTVENAKRMIAGGEE